MDRSTAASVAFPLWILAFVFGLSLFSFEPRFILTQPLAWILFLTVGLAYAGRFALQRAGITLRPWLLNVIPIVLLLGVMSWLFLPVMSAEWGQVDDHEIMTFLGEDQRLTLSEFLPTLLSTEVGQFGTYPRFRPVYFVLRLGETILWGFHVKWWYGFRFLLLTTSFLLYWQFLRPLVGRMWSSLLLIFVLTSSSWADIFARLGPSETYAVIGLAGLVVTGQTLWFSFLHRRVVPWWLSVCWGVSGVLCVGSKENMLIVLPVFGVLGLLAVWRRLSHPLFWMMQLLVWGVSIIVLWAVVSATQKMGSDVYGVPVDATSRVTVAILGLKHIFSKQTLFAGATVLLLVAQQLWHHRFRWASLTRMLVYAVFCIGALELVFLSQFVFYAANFPSYSRYDFPGVFVFIGVWVVVAKLAQMILRTAKVPQALVLGLQSAVMVGLVAMIVMRGFVGTRVRIQDHVKATHVFFQAQQRLHLEIARQPLWPIRLHVTDINQYEAVFSQLAYMRVLGTTTPVTLRLNIPLQTVKTGLPRLLFIQLLEAEQKGTARFAPRSTVTDPCWEVDVGTLTVVPCSGTSAEHL